MARFAGALGSAGFFFAACLIFANGWKNGSAPSGFAAFAYLGGQRRAAARGEVPPDPHVLASTSSDIRTQ